MATASRGALQVVVRGLTTRRRARVGSSGAPHKEAGLVAAGPEAWEAVRDKRSGGTYWWNRATGQTTAVGEPRPGSEEERALAAYRAEGHRPRSASAAVAEMAAWGFGVSVAFAVVARVVGG